MRAGLSALPDTVDSIFVLCGDVPLIPIDEMDALVRQQEGHALSVLTFKAAPPHGYGRMPRQGEQLLALARHPPIAMRRRRFKSQHRERMTFLLANQSVHLIDRDQRDVAA